MHQTVETLPVQFAVLYFEYLDEHVVVATGVEVLQVQLSYFGVHPAELLPVESVAKDKSLHYVVLIPDIYELHDHLLLLLVDAYTLVHLLTSPIEVVVLHLLYVVITQLCLPELLVEVTVHGLLLLRVVV